MAAKRTPVPPMSDTENYFIEERNEAIASQYDSQGKGGKWMLWFPISEINDRWEAACKLYNANKLPGIIYMKTSTAKIPESKGTSTGAKWNYANRGTIRFFCGPSDNKREMEAYGRILIKMFAYYSDYGFLAYKTEEQTAKGTRATGNKENFTYRLEVPKSPG